MPPPLSSFTSILTTAKPFAVKTLGPISTSVARQHYQQQQQQQEQTYSTFNKPAIVTENSILNSFPRPNLQTTLNSSPNLYNYLQSHKSLKQLCINCNGPHSTEFCPC